MSRVSARPYVATAGALLLLALVLLGAQAELLLPERPAQTGAALAIAVASGFLLLAWRREGPSREMPAILPGPSVSWEGLGEALGADDVAATYLVDREGIVRSCGRGVERLFGIAASEVLGKLALERVLAPDEALDFPDELRRVFESGRAPGARRVVLLVRGTERIEAVRALVPVRQGGAVVAVAVLHLVSGPVDDRAGRLADRSPAGLLALDAAGRVEAANARLSNWTGRRAGSLDGLDVASLEALPEGLRTRLAALAAASRGASPPNATLEEDADLVTPGGLSRPVHVFAATRLLGGVDAAFVDGTSVRRTRAERDAARAALEEFRSGEAAAAPEDDDGVTRVLLVEDHDENRELIGHMLRSRGVEVVEAESGQAAAEAAAVKRFDLVLLDLQMPGLDGFQTARRLRSLPGGGEIAIVALTALASAEIRERCEAEGMNGYESKPLTYARLGDVLARFGRGAPRAAPDA